MELNTDNIKNIKSIPVSRNRPLAFVVGAAGFLGSHLTDKLLDKHIQVVGVDDLSSGNLSNLDFAVRSRDFHWIQRQISEVFDLKLPRLDYAFWVVNPGRSESDYLSQLEGFLNFINAYRSNLVDSGVKTSSKDSNYPRIVMVSSVELYGKKLSKRELILKSAEIAFAKFVKKNGLNARVVRLAEVFGPRMVWKGDDPMSSLLRSAVEGRLQHENASLAFSTRAIYVTDAVELVLKSVLNGSTAQKIYDGVLSQPLKVTEVKQALLDPIWNREQGFEFSVLPPWVTPNYDRTVKELSWITKADLLLGMAETLNYFKDNPIDEVEEPQFEESTANISKPFFDKTVSINQDQSAQVDEVVRPKSSKRFWSKPLHAEHVNRWWGRLLVLVMLGVIGFGLVYPVVALGVGGLMIRNSLKAATLELERGDFDEATKQTSSARVTVTEISQALGWMRILSKMGILKQQFDEAEKLVLVVKDGVVGADTAVSGIRTLYRSAKIISGEDNSSPEEVYAQARTELQSARLRITKVMLQLSDPTLIKPLPAALKDRALDLSQKLEYYLTLVEKAEAIAAIMPEVTGVDGKRSYLLLFQNNTELRPTGGFIGSYGKIDFENGRISKVLVDDIYNLDGNLKEQITPPLELQTDMGQTNWYLRDSNWDPDFPTSARQAIFFYNKEAGERVNGVIALTLSGSAKLLSALGELNLPEYNEQVMGNNLFERAISHSETNFFPGSQEKRQYLTALQGQLFNRLFFLSNQNWPAIIQSLNESLTQKQLMIYLTDPLLFSYVSAQGWGGVIPRGTEIKEGELKDFVAVVEANVGANKSNYYLDRSVKLVSSVSEDDVMSHQLEITYRNRSEGETFPQGQYKNRLRIYLPAGSKMNKVMLGNNDISSLVTPFSDYGRSGFSMPMTVLPKQQVDLVINYQLGQKLGFKDGLLDYRLDVIKQPGTERDPWIWQFNYPTSIKLANQPDGGTVANQQLIISTNLVVDRSFSVVLSK